jgi:acetyl esterase/lipase
MAWILVLAAIVLVLAIIVVAIYMVAPVDFAGAGKVGFFALMFPLHLLAVTLVSLILAVISAWLDATAAAWIFAVVVVLSLAMALWPTVTLWVEARRMNIRLSLREYWATARHPNWGGPEPARTVVFGTAPDGTPLELDVWRLATGRRDVVLPAIVRLHGGGWVGGGRGLGSAWNRMLNQLGYVVFDVDYRLPPPERWRDEVGDIKSALAWVVKHAEKYHVDPERISIMGHSAGGNLAMLAAYSAGNPDLPPSCHAPVVPVRCVINLYGPADLIELYKSGGSLDYIRGCLDQYIGGTPDDYADRYRLVSPQAHVGAATPPTITLTGSSDRVIPVEQALLLDDALAQAGVTHELAVLPVTDHGFDANWGGFGTQIARAKITNFLKEHG